MFKNYQARTCSDCKHWKEYGSEEEGYCRKLSEVMYGDDEACSKFSSTSGSSKHQKQK